MSDLGLEWTRLILGYGLLAGRVCRSYDGHYRLHASIDGCAAHVPDWRFDQMRRTGLIDAEGRVTAGGRALAEQRDGEAQAE